MNASEFTCFLNDWDNASTEARLGILKEFIAKNSGKTAPELNNTFASAPSLFFTRLTAWLRLCHATVSQLDLLLKAVQVFVGSSGGNIFLSELIDIGGVPTLLQVLTLKNEVARYASLIIISSVTNNGRKCKEIICENYGVKVVAECLGTTQSIECQEACKCVLTGLATGNTKYEQQIFETMITLLKSKSPDAQQIASQIIQQIKPSTMSADVLGPCFTMLGSLQLFVQLEALQLLRMLSTYNHLRQHIVETLLALLKPQDADFCPVLLPDGKPHSEAALHAYIQQASASKVIGMLSRTCEEMAEMFLRNGCVEGLLFAMGNKYHSESQRQAGLTLKFFIETRVEVQNNVRTFLGETFYDQYMSEPGSFQHHASPVFISLLLSQQFTRKSTQ